MDMEKLKAHIGDEIARYSENLLLYEEDDREFDYGWDSGAKYTLEMLIDWIKTEEVE